ncbi:MAG: M15 family metallopeptidase [Bacilli bacterium]|nr:M15 family metallopeptidase [Bacilli bacterium]
MINENNKIVGKKAGKDKITIKHTISKIEATATITVKEEENKIETKDGITYVNGILIVNKTYSLPKDYDPGKINDDALNAFNEMKEAAAKDNIKLWIQSGYRSYKTQEGLYNNYVKEDGKDKADTYSARPGHSEHQSGYAMDLNIIGSAFEGTPEAIWIDKNCYKYGFIIRYPKGKENITGYKYEPWHIRYLGKENAKKVYESGKTLEEYLGIDSKYKNN